MAPASSWFRSVAESPPHDPSLPSTQLRWPRERVVLSSLAHHHLGRVDCLVRALVGSNLECLGHRIDPLKNMRDGWPQADAARRDQANRMSQMGLSADV